MNWHRTLSIAGAGAVAALAAGARSRLRRLEVVGPSMRPTLEEGDRLLVVRDGRARAGDLVVVPDPRDAGRLVVKRVVYSSVAGLTVRGDNPPASTDSRDFGPVAASSVRGRVVYRYAPAARRGSVLRLRGWTPWYGPASPGRLVP